MIPGPSKSQEIAPQSRKRSGPVLAARTSIYLWEFLLEILDDPGCSKIVRWIDKRSGEFIFLNADEVAKQWGIVKRRPNMDKIKMCRALRYYYQKGVIKKVKGRPFSYKFIELPYNHPTLNVPPPVPQTMTIPSCTTTVIWNVDEDTWETI